ncbi:hypothetical protein Syun_026144 [Stephania yunnanensis]|uniref:Major facilitator superfamily (MFS) profile domain-containing protein n=1 Tax=Stephania yunnanensis TaxID=152371 RepID=A0AAP0F1U8_9MAGN
MAIQNDLSKQSKALKIRSDDAVAIHDDSARSPDEGTSDSKPSWFTPKRCLCNESPFRCLSLLDGFLDSILSVKLPERKPNSQPSRFTPKSLSLLAIFCVINLINYIDRGAIATNGVNGSRGKCTADGKCTPGSGIHFLVMYLSLRMASRGHFNLSNFEDGVLSSAFMVGVLVASPIFASFAKSYNPFRLIGVGLSVWTLAVIGCGGSLNFWMIVVFRMFVGVGEASFISLAAPFIDDNAPVSQSYRIDFEHLDDILKAAWLGIFYMCIPTGIALGYVYGGLVFHLYAAIFTIISSQVGVHLGWRVAFFVEAVLMLPFVILGFVIKPLNLKEALIAGKKVGILAGNEKNNDSSLDKTPLPKDKVKPLNQFTRFWKDLRALLREKVFITNVLGYVAYNFVIGAYSYWGPKAGYGIYHMKNADMVFGGMTVICGILGTIAGGLVLDRMSPTLSNAFKLLSGTTLLGAIFCFAAFWSRNLYGFIALFAVGELFVFATQGPVNFVCLRCIEPSLRALSMALSTVSIHIFGDVPSSPIVGVIQDHLDNWRVTSLILTSILFLASAIWFVGIFLKGEDKFNKDNEGQAAADINSNLTPLPEGETIPTKAQEFV